MAIRALGFDVKKTDVQKIMNDFDKNNTGKISQNDFTEISQFSRKKLENTRGGNNKGGHLLKAMS